MSCVLTSRTKIRESSQLAAVGDMKSWLATRGALVATMSVYEDFIYYASGRYEHVTGIYIGEHCICCLGYDDADNARSWTAKNSWGPAWGTAGFFSIAYGDCGFGAEMWGLVP